MDKKEGGGGAEASTIKMFFLFFKILA